MSRDTAGLPVPWTWIASVVVASLLLSRAFACAMPFAALATVAAVHLRRQHAVVLVLAAWVGNQAIGFGLVHYPGTIPTLGWGVAIGTAALAAWAAAGGIMRVLAVPPPVGIGIGFGGALAAYELVLLAATAVLPSGPGAFASAVVLRIFAVNAVALLLLLAARRLGAVIGERGPGSVLPRRT